MVGQHCTRNVIVGRRGETLGEAAQRMRDSHVGTLVVVDNLEMRQPIGVLSGRDVVVGPVAQATEQVASLTIGDVMTTPAITARESESLDSALTTMERQGIRRLPVVDRAGSLTGILAVDDVLSHVMGELDKLVSLLARENEREHVRRP